MKDGNHSIGKAKVAQRASRDRWHPYTYREMKSTPSQVGIFLVAALGLLLWGLGMFWPAPKARDPLTLAVGVWPGSETLILARKEGGLQEPKINFVEMSWSSAAMVAYEKRVVDAAVVTLDELLRLSAAGHHPKAILVVGVSCGADAIMARPEIAKIEDLRGRRVGVEVRALGEYLLCRALVGVGMTLKDVKIVPLNLAETEGAYEEMGLDAVVTSDPWRIRLENKGAHALFDSKVLADEMSRVLMVREDVIDSYPAEFRAVVAAHFHVALKQLANGAMTERMAPILRREGLTTEQFHRVLDLIRTPDRKENMRLLTPGAAGLEPVLARMNEFMLKTALLKSPAKPTDVLDPEFVKGGE